MALLLVAASPVPWVALPALALAGATGVVVESLLTGRLQDACRTTTARAPSASPTRHGRRLPGGQPRHAGAWSRSSARAATVLVGGAGALVALVCWTGASRGQSRVATPRPSIRTVLPEAVTILSLPEVGTAKVPSTTS